MVSVYVKACCEIRQNEKVAPSCEAAFVFFGTIRLGYAFLCLPRRYPHVAADEASSTDVDTFY